MEIYSVNCTDIAIGHKGLLNVLYSELDYTKVEIVVIVIRMISFWQF